MRAALGDHAMVRAGVQARIDDTPGFDMVVKSVVNACTSSPSDTGNCTTQIGGGQPLSMIRVG